MPMIMQPSNQIKFTNVSIVRLKKGKKRYELACYKNKLLEYRSGAETDLDNVLQIPTVFLSVSRGHTAPTAELAKSFGKDYKTEDVIQEILRKGEVQVGEKERRDILDRVEKEVLEIVSARLVDPVSKRVYTTGMIGKALDQLSAASGQQQQQQQQQQHQHEVAEAEVDGDEEISKKTAELALTPRKPLWTGVTTSKSAKIQALDAMKALIAWQPIPVMRARMRLRITCPTSILKQPVRTVTSSAAAPGNSSNAPSSSKKEKSKGKKGKKAADDEEEDDQSKGAAATTSTPAAAGTVKDRILSYLEQIESQEVIGGDEWEVLGFAEPGAFKGLGEFIGGETKGKGRVEVMDMAVTHEE
ncbi:hypothetical protein MGYG_03499 [Nannizzia gypsea CBS 118893]|uniref:Shwachman-Bodian-Diamond syndrome protein n=1 Tax=Arthroderma gypseum (strain ATCC MYA-4604 / CBS 118893) TaxID=535722 RepID=E4USD0_ARTGP|nr:hypothetical protein MGYG_03499 [Nannizzia gypsea CBS 118893]EFR00497.1 hypothetical protein MGYG_03499 [Nannizzia gypsea CBS 118893]